MSMASRLWWTLAVGFVCGLAPAQGPVTPSLERQPGFGRVLDTKGEPWAGATVFFEHRAHPAVDDERFIHRVEVTSDERGQFRADLLPASQYVVWARGDVKEGRYRKSELVRRAVARSPILLREGEPGYVRKVRIGPADEDVSWEGVNPRYFLVEQIGGYDSPGAFARTRELPVNGGQITVPPTPCSVTDVWVWSRGFWVFRRSVAATFSGERQLLNRAKRHPADWPDPRVRKRVAGPTRILLRPLRARALALVDRQGKPMRDACFEPTWPSTRVSGGELARADSVGKLTAYVASERSDAVIWSGLLWTMDHEDTGLLGYDRLVRQGKPIVGFAGPGTVVQGRFRRGGDAPEDGVLLLESPLRTGPGTVDSQRRLVGIDQRGAFALPGRTEPLAYRLIAPLSSAERGRFSDHEFTAATVALVRSAQPQVEKALGTLELDGFRRLDLQATNPDGTPPGSLTIRIAEPREGEWRYPRRGLDVATDHRGRVRLLCADTADLMLLVVSDRGSVLRRVGPRNLRVQLALDARARVEVRVVQEDGAPVSGVHVGFRPDGRGFDPSESRNAGYINTGVRLTRSITDEDGRATVVAPWCSRGWRPCVWAQGRTIALDIDLTEREPGEVVEVVLPRR